MDPMRASYDRICSEIRGLRTSGGGSWIIPGDFNVIKFADERRALTITLATGRNSIILYKSTSVD